MAAIVLAIAHGPHCRPAATKLAAAMDNDPVYRLGRITAKGCCQHPAGVAIGPHRRAPPVVQPEGRSGIKKDHRNRLISKAGDGFGLQRRQRRIKCDVAQGWQRGADDQPSGRDCRAIGHGDGDPGSAQADAANGLVDADRFAPRWGWRMAARVLARRAACARLPSTGRRGDQAKPAPRSWRRFAHASGWQ
jgi:hypothetical protein